eukprot:7389687-Prymnesium_polylepis.1
MPSAEATRRCMSGCSAGRHAKTRRRYSRLSARGCSDALCTPAEWRTSVLAIVPAYPNELTPPLLPSSPASSSDTWTGSLHAAPLRSALSTYGLRTR